MGWNLPPGVTDRMIDEAQPSYWDALGNDDDGPTELDQVYDELYRARGLLELARKNMVGELSAEEAGALLVAINLCLGAQP